MNPILKMGLFIMRGGKLKGVKSRKIQRRVSRLMRDYGVGYADAVSIAESNLRTEAEIFEHIESVKKVIRARIAERKRAFLASRIGMAERAK
jgi:hypothetical protein